MSRYRTANDDQRIQHRKVLIAVGVAVIAILPGLVLPIPAQTLGNAVARVVQCFG
ncbi:MAG: hypothetical protein KKG00_08555 [Bacteroidetes bacterium]|nr:hypothetical protein [Bacteroidota bacterium]